MNVSVDLATDDAGAKQFLFPVLSSAKVLLEHSVLFGESGSMVQCS